MGVQRWTRLPPPFRRREPPCPAALGRWATAARSPAVGGAFEGLAGGPVGLVGGDAAGGEGGRRWEARVGQERPQGDPNPLGWRIRRESDTDFELLDPAGVERLVAPQRQQQLRHTVGEG